MDFIENCNQCQKCNGKMVYDRFYDYLDETGKFSFNGWRCLVCGEIIDPVIIENRKTKIHKTPKISRKRKFTIA